MTVPTNDESERNSTPAVWHATPVDSLARLLGIDPAHGLEPEVAAKRLFEDGFNDIRRGESISPLRIFANQFASLVIWILIAAALVSLFLGEIIDSIAILTIVFLNAVIGFFQEYHAEQAVAALARLAAPLSRVVRAGHAQVIPAREVVRGDILLLEAGDLVAADARLLDVASLQTAEAPLTGESEPVDKSTELVAAETALADRRNMVFLGTSVTSGTGRAVVVATGMATEVGGIAALLETASSGETPLQHKLDLVARHLLWVCLAIIGVVVGLGLLRGVPLIEMFMAGVSLAVAAIPEGLPAVVTISLALGVSRMVRRNALVRRLPSVETLGGVQVICTDKTGTLTVGQMTARKIVTIAEAFTVTGEGYGIEGGFYTDGRERDAAEAATLRELLVAAAACNEAELSEHEGRPAIVGDPTEGALLVAAAKGGIGRASTETRMPRIASYPFDSDRRRMTIVRMRQGASWGFTKGAPETILERCTGVLTEHGRRDLTEGDRERIRTAAALLANDALRVLALAQREYSSFPLPEEQDPEAGLTLLGLIGLQDPPRAEAREAVARCKSAGIRTVMITGDHPDTARAIARDLGILREGDSSLVGAELDRLTDRELTERVTSVAVYARVTAEHKLRIVRAWKANGAIAAMTGDGVNDAPALKEASIGIAMGISGTEVTKEAADMVITDDNFASIVAAVEEGRGIRDNITKTLAYLLAGNCAELAVMLAAGVVGWPLPLLPVQLLWINLVTDGLPALALATDPIDSDVLRRPPAPADAQLLDRSFVGSIAITGMLTAAVTLVGFGIEYSSGGRLVDARNAAFSVLVFAEVLRSFGARSRLRTAWEVGFLSNARLFAIVLASIGLQLTIHHVDLLESLFETQPISLGQCVTWLALGSLPLLVLEGLKLLRRGMRQPVAA